MVTIKKIIKIIKPYIKCNTDLQRNADKEGNKIKNQNAKLRNSAIFRKSIENLMNKVDLNIVTTSKQYFKQSFRPAFKREKQFRNGAIVGKKEKCKVNFDKPIYTGTRILDLSKVLIKDFPYNYIKKKYGDKTEILLRDTDSHSYKIEGENFYKDSEEVKRYLTLVITKKIQNNTVMQIT